MCLFDGRARVSLASVLVSSSGSIWCARGVHVYVFVFCSSVVFHAQRILILIYRRDKVRYGRRRCHQPSRQLLLNRWESASGVSRGTGRHKNVYWKELS